MLGVTLCVCLSAEPRLHARRVSLSFWKISNGHISATATGHPIHFVFVLGRIFEVGGSNGATIGWTKSKIAAVSRLV